MNAAEIAPARPHRGPNEQPPEAHGIGAPTSSALALARMGMLLAAWALVWSLTPQALLGAAWANFAWWTAMKGVVWIALGAFLFRPDGRRMWLGAYRGRIGVVALLAVAWIGLDALAVHGGVKAPPVPPTVNEMLRTWNASVNLLLIAPVLEEILFRGVFWSALERTDLRAVHVWLLSAAAFAALHVPGWIAMQAVALPQAGRESARSHRRVRIASTSK